MSRAPLAFARAIGVHDVTCIGGKLVGMDRNGSLRRWDGNRWVRLEAVRERARRRKAELIKPKPYAGHPAIAVSV